MSSASRSGVDTTSAATPRAAATASSTPSKSSATTATELCDPYCAGPYTAVVAGGLHTCALQAESKTVTCWGAGYYGQNGKNVNGPAQLTLPEVVRDLHLGYEHTCALLDGGEVRCWGLSAEGQLGVGGSTNVVPPADKIRPVGIFDAAPTLMCTK